MSSESGRGRLPASSAIIIGGGIGGLSAALHLRRAGLQVSVFEQRHELSEVNTGLTLWSFAVRRLNELGLGARLTAIGRPIDRMIHRSASDRLLGDVAVGPLAARVGAPSYEIHRSGLQRLLADSLGHETIEFERRCVAVRQDSGGVHAQFEDGGKASADILIGADGVHSAVRDAVLGPTELRRAQIGVWRGMAEMGQDELPAGHHLRYMGPSGLFGIARLSDELVRWYAAAPFTARQPQSGGEYKQLALDSFNGWPRLVCEALNRTYERDYLFNDTPHAPPFRTWGSGRITLLGDAAHSSVPTLGISAGLAIEDAAALGECVRAAAGEISGLRAYERQRRRVSARAVRSAALFGRVLMIRRQPAYALRNIAARLAPQHLAIRWLVGGAAWRRRSS